jgi:HD superfamily phosphodiesterase
MESTYQTKYATYFKLMKKYYKERDISHGWLHVQQVLENAMFICKYENITNERDIKIIVIASLGHDIWDHKYITPALSISIKHMFNIDLERNGVLGADRDLIIRIIDNISFSNESALRISGKSFDLEVPEERLRDIVSDADKLESLGETCIKRMIDFEIHFNKNQPVDIKRNMTCIKKHCRERLYILIEEKYIKTNTAIELAQPLMDKMKNIVENDLLLESFIKTHINTHSKTV